MIVKVELRYSVELSPQEFRVIAAALRGNLKDDEWKEALALQKRMLLERHKAAEQLLGETQKAADNIAAAKVAP